MQKKETEVLVYFSPWSSVSCEAIGWTIVNGALWIPIYNAYVQYYWKKIGCIEVIYTVRQWGSIFPCVEEVKNVTCASGCVVWGSTVLYKSTN